MILEVLSYEHLGSTSNNYHQSVAVKCNCCVHQALYITFDKTTRKLCKACGKKALPDDTHILLLKNDHEYARYSADKLNTAQDEADYLINKGHKVKIVWTIWDKI